MRATLVYIAIVIISCQDAVSVEKLEATSAGEARIDTSFTGLYLDSMQLRHFTKELDLPTAMSEDIFTFYRNRDYQYAWVTGSGLHEKTQMFWDLHLQYLKYTEDSSFYDRSLHNRVDSILHDPEANGQLASGQAALLEMQLTEHFFHYAAYAYGGRTSPDDFNWHIPAKKIDVVDLLDSLLAGSDTDERIWEPVSPQYKSMREVLKQYHRLEDLPAANAIVEPGDKRVYRTGDSSGVVARIKEKLQLFGDYPQQAVHAVYDGQLKLAVEKFQTRHGIAVDGIAGPQFFRALNVPVKERIRQLLINMERMRWMPEVKKGTRLVANIPSFTLHVFDGVKEMFNMDIVVGKAANRTVIFNDKLEYVVFSPYWNIPRSIVRKEILPAMNASPGYLSARNMEITGRSNGLPVIRQRPGGSNALGKVKFIFPNSYSIYFHDTPAKSLFEKDRRAFSHGCIRLKEPFRLAKYLLRDKEGWTDSRIRDAMNAGKEKWVKLEEKVPVLISYFTAWVDDAGVHFREDIYGHDKNMAEQLFK